ncbi:MAG: hypothetical protein IAA97_06050 [Spirochaetes bacterium]|uniref:Uncharacterized protein n=1 Tax=Candidatus Ornithospirochaeta stercoripullorum TaxID=2840899 RepID=A0A9D9H6D6_9SPIO|nr:hypothetical protein [Candidatus Ornithospirochaeta stercoripullorum]
MRQLFICIFIVIPLSSLNASWQFGFDLRDVDSAFMGAMRIDAEVSYRWDGVRVTLPLRYSSSYSYELSFFETGLAVSVYPLDDLGLYIGASMLRAGYFWGLEAPDERFMLFSEVFSGWTFSFPWFFIEPRLCVMDVFGTEEGRIGDLREAIPQYSKVRISLIVGVELP